MFRTLLPANPHGARLPEAFFALDELFIANRVHRLKLSLQKVAVNWGNKQSRTMLKISPRI